MIDDSAKLEEFRRRPENAAWAFGLASDPVLFKDLYDMDMIIVHRPDDAQVDASLSDRRPLLPHDLGRHAHVDTVRWAQRMRPGRFDPAAFPIKAVNEQLAKGVVEAALDAEEATWADEKDGPIPFPRAGS
ncbi:MAG: hypothetical protein FKY71_16165 [Spiribacter salinus]|uniref:Uncharacterized protein n=1 Tax=Spiribacter salinus TaxID=1335746 RepID=A0A540VKQ5_9GAMM|nr:MAG: hypothetical protein FKY71_16165 [Spiribacter salinus]